MGKLYECVNMIVDLNVRVGNVPVEGVIGNYGVESLNENRER